MNPTQRHGIVQAPNRGSTTRRSTISEAVSATRDRRRRGDLCSEGESGITINSFASISMDPPLVLASIMRTARSTTR